ncbi:MAG: hypothetical protein KatS3mg050_4382 [Litorilinea sp.]|nr:MAG: hypothetical protein KatS3mg050_4382 [Litorilinea sp.]
MVFIPRGQALRILILTAIVLLFAVGFQRSQTAMARNSVLAPATADLARETTQADGDKQLDQLLWDTWQSLPTEIRQKVDPRILAELRGQIWPTHLLGSSPAGARPPQPPEQTRFLVYMAQQPDAASLTGGVFASQVDQRSALYASLLAETRAAQAEVTASLQDLQAQAAVTSYQPFFIANVLAVEGNLAALIALAQRPDVARIVANYPVHSLGQPALSPPQEASTVDLSDANWNIELVGADRVWNELGIRGEGVVVATIDSGVNFQHPALTQRYRGYRSFQSFEHNYNWFDPDGNLYPNGNLGASRSRIPYDCDDLSSHGTHTMGTLVGDGGTEGTQVGMAPGARWIAVPALCSGDSSISDDITMLKAFQWLLCPTDLSGDLSTADCGKAPDVISNSWGSANPVNEVFRPIIRTLRAAGIAPVFAAGNPEAGPGSIGTPANAPEAIAVGATDRNDQLAGFSGQGPSFYEGEQKPEFTAPGVDVRSSVFGQEYAEYSGTSMAAPHVAGLFALLISADLQDGFRDFNVDELEYLVAATALDLGAPGPDDLYGYGRIQSEPAVRWALSAGDLRGTVRDGAQGTGVAGATVTGIRIDGQVHFSGQTDAAGAYSLTVPAGLYNLTVNAWGYEPATFERQAVISSTLSLADFRLTALPRAELRGQVRRGGEPVVGATVSVVEAPAVQATTDAAGQYSLSLPVGTHTLLAQAQGAKPARQEVAVPAEGTTRDFELEAAPSILLVNADAFSGWFSGWPVTTLFRWALDRTGYTYDQWSIQYLNQQDTFVREDGSVGYGIPSLNTLTNYDVVIWVHSGCSAWFFGCFGGGSPASIGAESVLAAYLDQGGRLILSGQDIGFWDAFSSFYQNYLRAAFVQDMAAQEGESLQGAGFLDGLSPKLTNASLYGYANGILGFWPDSVTPRTPIAGDAYPILTYANGDGAALAIAPCDASYRAVYFAMGYENIGPRGKERDPAIAEILSRSIEWTLSPRPDYRLDFSPSALQAVTAPGSTRTYQLQLINAGSQALTVQLSLTGHQWPTRLHQNGQEITGPLSIAPCTSARIMIQVDVPAEAANGAQDVASLVVDATNLPQQVIPLTTTSFAAWRDEAPMPRNRYDLALAAPNPGRYLYALGGIEQESDVASPDVHRFDVCTRSWEQMNPMPEPLHGAGVATLDNAIYVIGGYRSEVSEAEPWGETFSRHVYRYDPTSDSWSQENDLPMPLAYPAVATAQGKIYVFGGLTPDGATNHTLEYDPQTRSWTVKAPIPGGSRSEAGAARLGNLIYLIGNSTDSSRVDVYNPVADAWSSAPALRRGRQHPVVAAAADGFLYVAGGTDALGNPVPGVERFQPGMDSWQSISDLLDSNRWGAGMAYARGRLFLVGGRKSVVSVESLRLKSDFCLSNLAPAVNLVAPASHITMTLTLYASRTDIHQVRAEVPLPDGVTFTGFQPAVAGAQYLADEHRVEWQGSIPGDAVPVQVTFGIDLLPGQWVEGDYVTLEATFQGDNASFQDRATVLIAVPNLGASSKSVTPVRVLGGDTLTYRLDLVTNRPVAGTVTVRDPLPPNVHYVPDSLQVSNGSGRYLADTHTLEWTGEVIPDPDAYFNTSERFEWGDSLGRGAVDKVTFQWVDIQGSGTSLGGGDDFYVCGVPIGFPFPFFGVQQREFCVSTNGFVYFNAFAFPPLNTPCPLPHPMNGMDGLIAAAWGDLVVDDAIYYQTFGQAPERYLVVQWRGVRPFGIDGSAPGEFQLILHEDGSITFNVLQAGAIDGSFTATGLEDYSSSQGVNYACNQAGSLRDELAVRFIPPGVGQGKATAQLTFAATVEDSPAVNQVITNTAHIIHAESIIQRSAFATLNPLDLGTSSASREKEAVTASDVNTYRFVLRNNGLKAASNARLENRLPESLAYLPDTLSCSSGSCQVQGDTVTWTGEVAPGTPVTIAYDARLRTSYPDGTVIVNQAELDDGHGTRYLLSTSVRVRRSELGISTFSFLPAIREPGQSVTLLVHVRNQGSIATNARVTLPAIPGLVYDPASVVCGTGTCSFVNGQVEWTGVSEPRSLIPIRVTAAVSADLPYGTRLEPQVEIVDLDWQLTYRPQAQLWIARSYFIPFISGPDGGELYLPFVGR